MANPLHQAEPDRRDGARYSAHRVELLLESSIFLETVPLVEIGRRGFSVRTMISHPPGESLKLHIPDHDPIEAQAVWHSNNRLGARFVEPLDDAILLSLTGAN